MDLDFITAVWWQVCIPVSLNKQRIEMHNAAIRTSNNREACLFTCEHALFYVHSRHLLDIEHNCNPIVLNFQLPCRCYRGNSICCQLQSRFLIVISGTRNYSETCSGGKWHLYRWLVPFGVSARILGKWPLEESKRRREDWDIQILPSSQLTTFLKTIF
jgi:hypothetical protein